jgi:hypothetical protein
MPRCCRDTPPCPGHSASQKIAVRHGRGGNAGHSKRPTGRLFMSRLSSFAQTPAVNGCSLNASGALLRPRMKISGELATKPRRPRSGAFIVHGDRVEIFQPPKNSRPTLFLRTSGRFEGQLCAHNWCQTREANLSPHVINSGVAMMAVACRCSIPARTPRRYTGVGAGGARICSRMMLGSPAVC